MARPRKIIDWTAVEKLCYLQCTLAEIAGYLECDEKTLETACKRDQKQGFSDYYKSKAAGGKMSLRRLQWRNAEAGNVTMQIWLGKQMLGQRDKTDTEITGKDGGPISIHSNTDLSAYTTEELEQINAIHEAANARRDQEGTGGA